MNPKLKKALAFLLIAVYLAFFLAALCGVAWFIKNTFWPTPANITIAYAKPALQSLGDCRADKDGVIAISTMQNGVAHCEKHERAQWPTVPPYPVDVN